MTLAHPLLHLLEGDGDVGVVLEAGIDEGVAVAGAGGEFLDRR